MHNLKTSKSIVQMYKNCNLTFSDLIVDSESQDYQACSFQLNHETVLSRRAKITPTKIGQFVTLWKRVASGSIAPFENDDPFQLVIINTDNNQNFGLGQFVFPKSVLAKKGILTTSEKEGKRGFRIYPPWDNPTSKQAIRTQKWQICYFITFSPDHNIDTTLAKKLYSSVNSNT